eukprot:CAMPEP_0184315768 /NCGR_PEP_ID=MMETSP1049-20130417/85385_1 /TAXON_ID=77928 /ORGANISM="Proteomonas sulcata, Strain CCMP704" /LENGTH=567 /DNA_ID=CAMNT_0026634449 /DNA_START=171 /DNA_END=1874 /DNA_ORIENTATION=-
MAVNILWFADAGFPDHEMVRAGVISAFALLPFYPISVMIYRSIGPAAAKRRKEENDPEERQSDEGPKRTARVEVTSTIETVDTVHLEGRPPSVPLTVDQDQSGVPLVEQRPYEVVSDTAPPAQSLPSASTSAAFLGRRTPSPVPWDRSQLSGVSAESGPKTPRTERGQRPQVSTETKDALDAVLETDRPNILPPVRAAFSEDVMGDTGLQEAPHPRKKGKVKPRVAKLLPHSVIYLAYAISALVFCVSIAVATVHGTRLPPSTQYAFAIASVTTILFEFILFQPMLLFLQAFLEVRARLLRAMEAKKPEEPEPVEDVAPQPQTPLRQQPELEVEQEPAIVHDENVPMEIPGSPPEALEDEMSRQLADLVDAFIFAESSRRIAFSELVNVLSTISVTPEDPRIQEFWTSIEHDQDELHRVDWVVMLQNLSRSEVEQALLSLFMKLGHIENECKIVDLRSAFKNLMTEPHLQTIIVEADSNDDGFASFEEVTAGFMRLMEVLQDEQDEDEDEDMVFDMLQSEAEVGIQNRVIRQIKAAISRLDMSRSRSVAPRSRDLVAKDLEPALLDA